MRKVIVWAIILILCQFPAALISGPYSCEWGNTFYFWFGLSCLLATLALVMAQKSWDIVKRLSYAAMFSVLLLLVWLAGFMLGDFSILCRLF